MFEEWCCPLPIMASFTHEDLHMGYPMITGNIKYVKRWGEAKDQHCQFVQIVLEQTMVNAESELIYTMLNSTTGSDLVEVKTSSSSHLFCVFYTLEAEVLKSSTRRIDPFSQGAIIHEIES